MKKAIVVTNVSKKYALRADRPMLVKSLFPQKKEEYFALKDVSLTINQGETVGIIGENGAGKSTLLKIIAGIATPTSGTVKVSGRVVSLIELGAGFHPDLTGKENVYLNAMLLGLTKKQVDERYNDIISFADIGEYINQPIRTYSSGMVVRLGFAVAVHLDPDILLIDEVLAVGDEEFQRKSLQKIKHLHKKNITMIIVSHNLAMIGSLCINTIYIHEGTLKMLGHSDVVLKHYLDESYWNNIQNQTSPLQKSRIKEIVLKNITLKNLLGKTTNIFNSLDTIIITCEFIIYQKVTDLNIGISLYSQHGEYVFGTNTKIDKYSFNLEKNNKISLKLDHVRLLPGAYSIGVGICEGNNWYYPVDSKTNATTFFIKSNQKTEGLINIAHEWMQV